MAGRPLIGFLAGPASWTVLIYPNSQITELPDSPGMKSACIANQIRILGFVGTTTLSRRLDDYQTVAVQVFQRAVFPPRCLLDGADLHVLFLEVRMGL